MNQTPITPLTLEEISKRKKDLKKEIDKQKIYILEITGNLFSPMPQSNGVSSFMQSFNKGLALYDGVMTGIKLMKKIRLFFNKKEKNN